jgi:MinD-like ATPase involved in chromosome partitioning or flagellar assembly
MKTLFLSLKGGVGKSSIATVMTSITGYPYVTNDLTVPIAHKNTTIQIEADKKRIPKSILDLEDAIFDFGANSTHLDPKISQLLYHVNLIIIPMRPDQRSLIATLETIRLLDDVKVPIVIIINNFKDMKKYEKFRDILINKLGRTPIYFIRETTLFDRIAEDGIHWYENINNDMGEYQLQKTNLYITGVIKRAMAHAKVIV